MLVAGIIIRKETERVSQKQTLRKSTEEIAINNLPGTEYIPLQEGIQLPVQLREMHRVPSTKHMSFGIGYGINQNSTSKSIKANRVSSSHHQIREGADEVETCNNSISTGSSYSRARSHFTAPANVQSMQVSSRQSGNSRSPSEGEKAGRRRGSVPPTFVLPAPAISRHMHTTSFASPNSSYMNKNDVRKEKRALQLLMLAEDLVESVVALCMVEQKTSFVLDVVREWSVEKVDNNKNYPHLVKDDEIDDVVTYEQAESAIHNFLSMLPARYAVGIDVPSEILVHMRFVAAAKRDPMNAALHISSLEDSQRLAFCPVSSGMENLKLITIACAHTIGLMEMVMGTLVSGGSEILETDYLLTSEKIMLINCIVNVKGPIQLENLEDKIGVYLKAARGTICESADALETFVPGRIGAPVEINQMEYVSVSRAEVVSDSLERSDLTKAETNFDSPLLLSDMLGGNYKGGGDSNGVGSQIVSDGSSSSRKTLRRRGTIIDLGPALNGITASETDDQSMKSVKAIDEFNDSKVCSDISRHDFFRDIIVTGAIKAGADGVVVYRGRSSKDKSDSGNCTVALKVLEYRSEHDLVTMEKLKDEGTMAMTLCHTNICRLIDMVVTEDFVCLAYEYCSKGNLSIILSDQNVTYDYLNLAQDISNGMAYLHSKNIIHRDLKPENIFITHDNRAKIADFGLSITDTGGRNLTGETGTYRWMAPEIIRHESYSINSDIYSFGLILWQLVTNSPQPFKGISPIQTAFAVAKGERPAIPNNVADFMKRVISSCWDHDQLRRPSFAFCSIALAQYSRVANINYQEHYSAY